MIPLVALNSYGTLAESKQPLNDTMGEAFAGLLAIARIAPISGERGTAIPERVAGSGRRQNLGNYGLRRLRDAGGIGIPLDQMLFVGKRRLPRR
ncbi:hypothetical protein F4779DRAFT_621569 [Xylariaceae sp. FL0662B]|nr:hypothetical protein F4779DRAFT_621569 [Xylariaceae sp. FL0662B]